MFKVLKGRKRQKRGFLGVDERDRCRAVLEVDFGVPVTSGSVCDRLPRLMLAEVLSMKNGSNAVLSSKNGLLAWTEKVTAVDGRIYEVTIQTTPRHPFQAPRVTISPEPVFATETLKNKDGGIELVGRSEYAGRMSVLDLRNKVISFLN